MGNLKARLEVRGKLGSKTLYSLLLFTPRYFALFVSICFSIQENSL